MRRWDQWAADGDIGSGDADSNAATARLPRSQRRRAKSTGRDISIVARALFSRPGMRHWNTAADVNGDGKVNLVDLFLVIQSSHDKQCHESGHHF